MKATKATYSRLAGLALLLTLGCAPKPVAISGRVTLNGQPLDEAALQFVPLSAGQRKTSCEVLDGEYHLPEKIGLIPGQYRVDVVDLPPLSHAGGPRRLFPTRYSNQSPLSISIEPNGPRSFDFNLQSTP